MSEDKELNKLRILLNAVEAIEEVRRYDADPKNYVWCVSYNPDVADEELPRSMIRGVWKVIKYIADFGW